MTEYEQYRLLLYVEEREQRIASIQPLIKALTLIHNLSIPRFIIVSGEVTTIDDGLSPELRVQKQMIEEEIHHILSQPYRHPLDNAGEVR